MESVLPGLPEKTLLVTLLLVMLDLDHVLFFVTRKTMQTVITWSFDMSTQITMKFNL